jgi:hypothetical protein
VPHARGPAVPRDPEHLGLEQDLPSGILERRAEFIDEILLRPDAVGGSLGSVAVAQYKRARRVAELALIMARCAGQRVAGEATAFE